MAGVGLGDRRARRDRSDEWQRARTVDRRPLGTGVVVVKTSLGYQRSAGTGTGIVLTSSGKILTNNHVIRGATRITVVVPGTSLSYTARVVGYAVADDVAVLRADGASNLATVKTSQAKVAVGDRVTVVGNGGGTGTLHSVTGSITTLRRSIFVRDDARGAVRLAGLMGTSADVEPGDSGGPLLNSANAVIGMITAGPPGVYPERAPRPMRFRSSGRCRSSGRSTPDAPPRESTSERRPSSASRSRRTCAMATPRRGVRSSKASCVAVPPQRRDLVRAT